ncbi:hypothetical protein ACQZ4Q_10855 [Agrobacterium vitis]
MVHFLHYQAGKEVNVCAVVLITFRFILELKKGWIASLWRAQKQNIRGTFVGLFVPLFAFDVFLF